MTWPTGNIDITKFDADSDSISASRPELYKIAVAVNEIANAGPIGNGNGVPGGSSGSLQYNNAGNFGGIGTVDVANSKITLGTIEANTVSGFKRLTGNGYEAGGGGTIQYISYVGEPAVVFSNGDSGAGHAALRLISQDTSLQIANLAGNINTVLLTNGNISTTGTITTTQNLQVTGTSTLTGQVALGTDRINRALQSKNNNSTGTAGDISWDANYIYVCTATNSWKRVALSTF
jgi:hypothetical protein